MRPEDREPIQRDVTSRVTARHLAIAETRDGHLEDVVNDTLYWERRRLESEPDSNPRKKADLAFYAEIQRRRRDASDAELAQILEDLVRHFVAEIVGSFDERVYKLSTTVVPVGLTVLLNAMSPQRLLSIDTLKTGIAQHVEIAGAVEQVRALAERGTLIVTPTHSSNLDSIILGYTAHRMGLPPLLYGAGLNLFTNPLISFFMKNLGAYRVDRRKKAPLYKEVLKEYATCSLEMGYHNLFFPGGTRSRSGAVETHLKRGLLGTGLRAYIENLRAGRERPNIYVCPCTLNYKLVLEAETLIEDHLAEVGKSRYIIVDDEFSRPREVYRFLSRLVSLDARITVHFGEPLDVFGNRVDADGQSRDPHGRPIDIRRYVYRDGEPAIDEQRDRQYTNELAEEIVRSYLRHNVLMSTHVVAFAIFQLLRRGNPGLDLYRLLRTGGKTPWFPLDAVEDEVARVLAALADLPEPPHLASDVAGADPSAIVADALRHYAIFHSKPAAVRRGDRVFPEHRNLILYYGNRLRGYGLGRILARGETPEARAA